MKLLAFVGSPRKEGNTAVLVHEIVKAAQRQGAETAIIYVNDLTMRGCQACMGCKKKGRCVLKDDMAPIYDQIIAADAVVLASPMYMGCMTGQLKLFIDRMYPFLNLNLTSNLPKGKKAALVFTQGQPDTETYNLYFQSVMGFLKCLGFSVCENVLVGAGVQEPGAIAQNAATMQAARALARQLCGG
ncbi:MAG: flavodoxin family protein [Phycisphaerae bacterium]